MSFNDMPKLGFGLMRLPEKDGAIDMEAVQKMVDAYIGNGFNYFDTMPVYTFLGSHRFDGKKVIPFSTHGGSGLAGTVAKVAQAEPGADVENNAYTVSRDDVVQAKDSVLSWLAQLGY